jgi:hypothetical protein
MKNKAIGKKTKNMSNINVTENEDLSLTIEGVEPDEMNHFFRKGLKTMIDVTVGTGKFIVTEPVVLKQKPANIAKAFGILAELNSPEGFFEGKRADAKYLEISDTDYHDIVQIGITKILMDHLNLEISNEWSGDDNERRF